MNVELSQKPANTKFSAFLFLGSSLKWQKKVSNLVSKFLKNYYSPDSKNLYTHAMKNNKSSF
jgi:hypothetical protein